MKFLALIFEKAAPSWNCGLLQIIGGTLKHLPCWIFSMYQLLPNFYPINL